MARTTSRRDFIYTSLLAAAASAAPGYASAAQRKPNMIVIFCDDLGYGDLSVFGHPTIRTPYLDRMAAEGQKWTNFYVGASVCTPSRAALLTGRLPIRNGMCSDRRRVLFPDSAGGLPQDEVTIADALKTQGYATACVGKWHLGHLPEFLPTRQGFDSYFGIPYSNDMDRVEGVGRKEFWDARSEYWNVPLLRNEEEIERPANQETITKRYNEEAVKFIKANKDQPFFLYLAHSLPHVPLFRSDEFKGRSPRGIYGDVIEEIDYGVGQIVRALYEEDIAEDTIVVFTSDNGPWLSYDDHGGSAGLLRDGKGTTFEGGMRVPTIFWGPGRVKPGIVHEMGSTLDLLPTFCAMSGADAPEDRYLDGLDLTPALAGTGPSPRKTMFYYRGQQLYAVRKGAFKAHYITQHSYKRDNNRQEHDPPELYNLLVDPSEKYNIADKHPDVIKDIAKTVEMHKAGLGDPVDHLVERIQ